MKNIHHSLTITIKRKPNGYFLSFKAVGKLSIEDYEMISPIIVSIFNAEQHPQLDVLIDVTQFDGWTLRSAWNDLIMGIKHSGELHRVAIFGNENWQNLISKASNWFIAGDIRFFDTRLSAINWIEKE
ncbi:MULTISPECIES: STAS/SEC14 domain-containing protein [Colwelliaceae]|uniref:STAS/SEC14 domain-containing protein n=1 Tax=Colwelliaceae TaxID=267889 RepID=UPI0009704BA6|nr:MULTISPECIES: STAS/SEC14 domain-containing protein [Colwelliaceae]